YQRNGLFVIHRHASEGFADIPRRGDWIGISIRPLRIDVDQTHLNSAQRIVELAVALVALVSQPFRFRTPENILRRLPDIRAASGKTEGLEAHRLQGDVTGEDHEIRPGDYPPILLL